MPKEKGFNIGKNYSSEQIMSTAAYFGIKNGIKETLITLYF